MSRDNPVLIVIPTADELDHFMAALHARGARVEESTHGRMATWTVSSLNAVVARGGLGKVQFAVHTQHLLNVGEWRLVLCIGSAGALSDDLAIGDVVIASETIEHDIKKVARPMMPRFAAPASLLARSPSLDEVRVHVGAIASGDEDVVDLRRRDELRRATGAIAVAWEGAGGARACQFSAVDFIEIRAIADVANADGPRDFTAYLATAMRNLALVVSSVVDPGDP